jgi:hypothetical protein
VILGWSGAAGRAYHLQVADLLRISSTTRRAARLTAMITKLADKSATDAPGWHGRTKIFEKSVG